MDGQTSMLLAALVGFGIGLLLWSLLTAGGLH
jgi:hypothetical protein